jgi:hypothetical protein
MPINRQTLLTDLKRWVTRFENDLREQCKELPELDARLKGQYDLAKKAGRTALAYSVWRDDELTQSAVAWVLSGVFVRFLEDNDLLEKTWISGLGENRELASQTRGVYFTEHRTHSDDDYLRHIFTEVGRLPGMADLMDARHNALWNASISGDTAKEFIEFWRRIDPATGALAHDFSDPEWDTRFLGDLYQDLSESARKKYALLQTPDFVEEFILDRTLDPAIDTFGLKEVRMIDPTCGSGHFVLGGFRRLLRLWQAARPDLSERELAVHALNGVYGVDINPFAVAIARFRLLLEAWRFCGVRRLRHAPDFQVNLAVGDSLLHGARFDSTGKPYVIEHQTLFGGEEAAFKDEMAHCFAVEDAKELHRILGQQYHAVVGNPPYITVKDRALNQLYRRRYDSCAGKYALSVPFMERFFDLAVTGSGDGRQSAGFTGQITSNSFMKREFGKKLIETFIPRWDLTHVIDTSGAYIPGHGTPTVIIFGRNQIPLTTNVRILEGTRGEPITPSDPRLGRVWLALLDLADLESSENEFAKSTTPDRAVIQHHPWILSELARELNDRFPRKLAKLITRGSIGVVTLEDDAFVLEELLVRTPSNLKVSTRQIVEGDLIRDWVEPEGLMILYPYDSDANASASHVPLRCIWPYKVNLRNRTWFRKTQDQRGMAWWEYGFLSDEIAKRKLIITFSFVGTHNQFVLNRGEKVFKQSAPVIKLPVDATEDDHLLLLGLLNSAASCFWMKQVFHCKGSTVDSKGARQTTVPFEDFYEFDGTKLKQFPIPTGSPLTLARELDRLAQELSQLSPEALADRDEVDAAALSRAEHTAATIRARMISFQEELDWQCYRHYGLIDAEDHLEWPEDRFGELPPLTLGERTFEIFMARQMARCTFETTWFERHKEAGSRPITEPPAHWPADYTALYHRRHEAMQSNPNLKLIERPEYKRRWNTEPWAKRQQEALRQWLLTRLEGFFFDADRMITGEDDTTTAAKLAHLHPIRARFAAGTEPRLASLRQLAGTASTDPQWMEAAAVYTARHDFDVPKLVEDLVLAESVPALPAQRYKAPGLRKRVEWEKTWDLQRQEDAVEARVRRENPSKSEDDLKKLIRQAQQTEIGDIPVPPKYGSGDFAKTSYWKLRGKLNVPKERWILYPGAEGGHDASPVIAWAGWDHAQQAQALAGYYQQAKDTWGWTPTRLTPLLAALKDLLPWLHQWHNALDPEFGDRISTTFQHFYDTERQGLRLTEGDVEAIRMGETNI